MKLSRLLLSIAVCTPLLALRPAHAQQAPVSFGQRVRVTPAAGAATRGTVTRVDAAGLVVRPRGTADTVYTAWRDVRRLEVSGGTSPGMSGVRYGALGLVAGAATGALIGYSTYEEYDDGSDWCIVICTREEAALAAGVGLGAVAGTAGFVLGVIFPSERWRPTALPVRVSVAPARGSGVALTGQLRF